MRTHAEHRLALVVLCAVLAITGVACGATPTPTKVPPTATVVPPTATAVPPTATKARRQRRLCHPRRRLFHRSANRSADRKRPVELGCSVGCRSANWSAPFRQPGQGQSFAMKINMDTPTSTMPFTGTIVMEIVQTPTQTVHMKIGDQIETIVAGQDVYTKMGTTWQKSTMALPQIQEMMSSFDYSKSLKPEDSPRLSMTRVGSEKVDNLDTEVYTLVMPQGQTVKLWINKTDKTCVKLVQQDKSGTVTVTFSDWNKVKIDLPKQ